jgi:hypothetical protein
MVFVNAALARVVTAADGCMLAISTDVGVPIAFCHTFFI